MEKSQLTAASKQTWILTLLLLAGTFAALFWRLDGAYLWRDETTTADWARTMVQNHSLVPYVFDGKTLAVQGFDAHDFNEHLTPGMQGWLQFYVEALSFQLFGVNTFTARLPFAVIGFLSVLVLWGIGRRFYPRGNLALLFPLLAIASIWFLTAARQARYYGLVFLFGSLLLYEFLRYLEDRGLADRASWYLRISLWSAGMYLSNYLGFAGMYAALCLYVLLVGDRKLILRWSTMTVILAVIFGAEFFSFHFDFASTWTSSSQPWESDTATIWDKLRNARTTHSEENFRMLPMLFLIPGVFYLFFGKRGRQETSSAKVPLWTVGLAWAFTVAVFFAKGTSALTWLSIGMTFALAATAWERFRSLRKNSPGTMPGTSAWLLPVLLGGMVVYGLGVEHTPENYLLYLCAELLAVGLAVFAVIRLRPKNGRELTPLSGMVLLTVLVIVISVFLTVFVGLDKGLPRYYYHVLAATLVLTGLMVAEWFRRGQRALAIFLLAGVLFWPDINYHVESSYSIVMRQLLKNRTIDYPVIAFLREHAKAGERIVVYRNVQGMMIHFYLPDLEWVGQLDSTNPRALHFQDRLPPTAYDNVTGVEWYALWDTHGVTPRGLDEEHYEKVWDYTYRYFRPWWDTKRGIVDERRWQIYQRKKNTLEPDTGNALAGSER